MLQLLDFELRPFRLRDSTRAGRALERIPQKLTDFCDQNSLQLFDRRDFLSLERFRSSGKRAKSLTVKGQPQP